MPGDRYGFGRDHVFSDQAWEHILEQGRLARPAAPWLRDELDFMASQFGSMDVGEWEPRPTRARPAVAAAEATDRLIAALGDLPYDLHLSLGAVLAGHGLQAVYQLVVMDDEGATADTFDPTPTRQVSAAKVVPALEKLLSDVRQLLVEEARIRRPRRGRKRTTSVRDMLLIRLARTFSRAGGIPTSTRTGPFAAFCHAFFEEIEWSTVGVEPALADAVAWWKGWQRNRSTNST